MLTDSSKKTRLIIQDLNKLSLLENGNTSLPRETSLQAKPLLKRSLLSNLKSERKGGKAEEECERGMGSSKGLWESPGTAFSSRKIVFLPQKSFDSNSSKDCG